ncbi:MAG TPA: hypothetical protein PLQ35_12195 [bacterium]|nr:hypothetical protein [bacterium]HQL63046.1 hypothetical protein [bacterium]
MKKYPQSADCGPSRKGNGSKPRKRFEDLEPWQRDFCERFKALYPNPGKPDRTDRWFARQNPTRETFEQILAAVEEQKNSPNPTRLNRSDPQYIPDGITWLEDGDWKVNGKAFKGHHPGESDWSQHVPTVPSPDDDLPF